MREEHRLRIGWHPWLPADGCGQQPLVHMEEQQIRPAGIEPVGRQMYLLRCRKMDKADGIEGAWTVLARVLGDSPLVSGTDVQKHLLTMHRPQLR